MFTAATPWPITINYLIAHLHNELLGGIRDEAWGKAGFFGFFLFMFDIQHCFICRPSTVSEDAGIEPRTVATTALAVRRFNHSVRSHPQRERERGKGIAIFCYDKKL
jgi:hypothetical protein